MLCPHPLAFVIAKIFIIVVLTKKMLYFSYTTPKIIYIDPTSCRQNLT